MKFCFEIDPEKLNISDQEKSQLREEGQKKLFESFLNTLLAKKFPDGVETSYVDIMQTVLDKIDSSQDNHIDLDMKEFSFFSSIFFDGGFKILPQQIRYFIELRKNIEKMTNGSNQQ